MEKDRVLAEIREAIELNRTVKQKNNDALSHAEYLLNREDEYNRGLNDAWELAKKVWTNDDRENQEMFGTLVVKDIFSLTPQEALAKLEAYEKAKDEIKVGDIVSNGNVTMLVTGVGGNSGLLFLLGENGEIFTRQKPEHWAKTGKHIDISALLEEIGEE